MPIPKLVVTVALAAAQMALTASRKFEGPRLENLEVTVADYNTPLNYFYGTRRFQGVPIIWAEPLREVKKKRKTKGGKFNEYRYYGTWAVVVADHEIDAVTKIWFDKHLVYDATQGGPISAINGRDLVGTMRIYTGTETQEPDARMLSTVEAEHGVGSCPAYRGVANIVFEEIGLEPFGNRIPQVSVEAVSNGTPSYPYDAVDTDGSNSRRYAISSSGSWLAYFSQASDIEWWDLPSRTRLGESDDGGILTGDLDMIGLAPDGTAYYMGVRIVGVDLATNFYTVSPLGVAVRSPDLDTSTGHGTITRAFNVLGANVVYSNRDQQGYFYFGEWTDHSAGCARDFFQDQDAQVWGIFQPDGASSDFTLVEMGGGGAQYTFTGTARGDVSAARGCATGHNTYFIVMDGTYYSIDRDDMTLLDSGVWSRGTDYDILPFQFPGRTTWWDGLVEFSLLDGSTIRTHASGWSHGQAAHTSTYDPINHALLIRPQFVDDLIWNYLDRVSGAGVTLGSIVAAVSEECGIVAADRETSDLDQIVLGYSWTQGSGKSIIEPMLDAHDSFCRPHDFKTQFLKRTGISGGSITVEEFARNGSDARYSITIEQDTDIPRFASLGFADIDAEQQPNAAFVQRTSSAVDSQRSISIDMATWATNADTAKQYFERWFRRKWNARERIRNKLNSQEQGLEPGDVQTLVLDASLSRTSSLEKLTFVADTSLEVEWIRDFANLALLSSSVGAVQDGRRDSVILIPMESRAFALDIPLLNDADDNVSPLLYMGAAPYSEDGFWPGAILYQQEGTEYDLEVGSVDSTSDATWGVATTALADASHYVWDRGNSVNVVLRNGATLAAATEAECNANPRLNRFALGADDRWETIQFTTPTLQGNGSWTLTGLLRGRRGTEWATGLHTSSDLFVMLDQLAPVEMSAGDIGEDLSFKAATNGKDVDSAAPDDVDDYTAASHRPWAPAQFKAVKSSANGDWTFTWKRRSRVAGDFSPHDPPLGESAENYEVYIYDGSNAIRRTITATSETATWTTAQQNDDFDMGQTTVTAGVVQIGDLADGYETTLTETSAVAVTGFWDNTILLCGCEGTNGADADLDDESFANHANGVSQGSGVSDAIYDAGTKMFGSSSVRFDSGFNDLIRFADHADWTLGTSDFTLEFFWRTNNATQITTTSTIICHYDATGNQKGWMLQYRGGDATDVLRFTGSSDGSSDTTLLEANWTPVSDTWYYICVERSGNIWRLYVGEPGGTATMLDTNTDAISLFNSTAPLQISSTSANEATCMGGVNMDEIRFTTAARYNDDAGYPVPSAAFPRGL